MLRVTGEPDPVASAAARKRTRSHHRWKGYILPPYQSITHHGGIQMAYRRKGKGWRYDSNRHALAARGIETAGPQTNPEGGNIVINVKGSETHESSQPSRPAFLPSGPMTSGPEEPEGREAIVTFEEDEKLDKEIEDMQSSISGFDQRIKDSEAEYNNLRDEVNTQRSIHKTEQDELVTKLAGKKPGMWFNFKDLPPAKQKQFQALKLRQGKELAAIESKAQMKRAEIDTLRARKYAKDRELSRRLSQVRNIKGIREKEQLSRVKTLEETRTLNRLLEEGKE
jgi:prefoldin subunit 5